MNRTLGALLALALSILSLGGRAEAASINVASEYNLGHPVVQRVLLPWAEEVRVRSEGRLEIRFYNPGVLVPQREHFAAAQDGRLKAAQGRIAAEPGSLKLSGLMDLPSAMTNPLSASEAFWRLYQEVPGIQREFRGIKLLALHASPPYQISLLSSNIRQLSDFRGQRVLTTPNGDSARLLRSLGSSPIITPVRDFASTLGRNTADGCLLPLPALRSASLGDKLHSITLCDLRMDAYWFGMNMDAFIALPEEDRRILNELSGLPLSLAIARTLNDMNNLSLSELIKEEVTVNRLSQEERDRWLAQATPALRESWIRPLEQAGVAEAGEIWNQAQEIFREAQLKWGNRTGQQITVTE